MACLYNRDGEFDTLREYEYDYLNPQYWRR